MNDDELRRSAQAERRRIIEATDVDGALADVRARIESGVRTSTQPEREPRPMRRWTVWAAAAATLAVVGGVVIATRSDSDSTIRIVDVPAPTESSTATSLPETVTTPDLDPTTTVAPTFSVVPTASTPEPPPPSLPTQTIAVSYDDPPPLIDPVPIASVPLAPNPNGRPISVAIGETEIAVSQPDTGVVTLVGYELGAGTATGVRTVDGAEALFSTVLGPGDVLYGFGDIVIVEGSAVPDVRFVAMPLSGGREGEVVAERRFSASQYTELPPAAFGHGPDGVVDRDRDVNATMLDYVDVTGAPVTWPGEPPVLLTSDWSVDGRGRAVAVVGGDLAWNLQITADPTNGGSYVGPSPPAPTSGGRVVYSDTIGADLTPDQDFGPSAMPVVAILEPDGSGRWVRLPDDWSVVSSDVWGTVLARFTGTTAELALLDDALAAAAPG